jgi:type VI secretion system protein ImpG
MDPRLLQYYNRELQFLRESGSEFRRAFPKVAGRLGLETLECQDPYVERLLEGFAFLAARVQLKLDAEFPRFTEHLLEAVHPNSLAPIPSMAVVQFQPQLDDGNLAPSFVLPRGSVLRGQFHRSSPTRCEFRTAHPVALWPLEVAEAQYLRRDTPGFSVPHQAGRDVKAAIRLVLRTTAGLRFDQLSLRNLVVHLAGVEQIPYRLHEALLAHAISVHVRPHRRSEEWHESLPAHSLRRVGYSDEEALLPVTLRAFQGHRLLQEYFTCPQRFLFVEFTGLDQAVARHSGNELELVVLLNRLDTTLERLVDHEAFRLHCTPAINLFPRRADRVTLEVNTPEHHLIVDRSRPLDFEVHSVTTLQGYGTAADQVQQFLPFHGLAEGQPAEAYYTLRRVPRTVTERQAQLGLRSTYIGTETYLSLVDGQSGPYRGETKQLAAEVLCTNRDLPLVLPVEGTDSDFQLDASAPISGVRCLIGPTRPRSSPALGSGQAAWRLISQLSLNYLSLVGEERGAAPLRELLELYTDPSQPAYARQIEGLVSIASQPVVRRIPLPGPLVCGRGLQVTLTFDETAFEGQGIFTLASVLEELFARHVTLNSFTTTQLVSLSRGPVAEWPVRIGRRSLA